MNCYCCNGKPGDVDELAWTCPKTGKWVCGECLAAARDIVMGLGRGMESMRRLRMKPGDRIVLQFKVPMRPEAHDRCHEHLRKFFGPDVGVLILEPDVDLSVIGPPE